MLFSRYHHTDFKAGGLVLGDSVLRASLVSKSFVSPAYIDSRPYCIESSNQGDSSACAGFTMAGLKEIRNWQDTGVPVQFDGHACYAKAKSIDGRPQSPGTTLDHALAAAAKLGWFADSASIIGVSGERELRFALHRHGACAVGLRITEEWNSVNKTTGYIADDPEARVMGGHAVLACYYDKDGVGVQNSWGDWGCAGFGRLTWAQFRRQFVCGVAV